MLIIFNILKRKEEPFHIGNCDFLISRGLYIGLKTIYPSPSPQKNDIFPLKATYKYLPFTYP
jgi:hypothetical protein